jgi:hypothetical protein
MNGVDPYLVEKLMKTSVSEQQSQARSRHLARLSRPVQLAWLPRQARAAACRIGYSMVALSAWLESFAQPSTLLMSAGGRLVRAGLPGYVPVRARSSA